MKQAAANGLLENCPVLIIDDEADQATVNAASKPLTQRTKIHSLITEIVGIPPRCTYVGYTATPFANVLMNAKPEDSLYPRDFIFSLPKPDGYFGSADMFGQELAEIEEEAVSFDYVRTVESDDATGISPTGDSKDPYIPQSLWQATRWFLMASAARYARGQESHSSMLVHTSPRVEEHTKMALAFKEILLPTLRNEWSNEIRRAEGWEKQWNAEIAREPAKKHGLQPIAFDQLVPTCQRFLTMSVSPRTTTGHRVASSTDPNRGQLSQSGVTRFPEGLLSRAWSRPTLCEGLQPMTRYCRWDVGSGTGRATPILCVFGPPENCGATFDSCRSSRKICGEKSIAIWMRTSGLDCWLRGSERTHHLEWWHPTKWSLLSRPVFPFGGRHPSDDVFQPSRCRCDWWKSTRGKETTN
jgi:hypothetical protein